MDDATALRLDRLADELAVRCHRLAQVTATSEWDGPAARAFRRTADEVLVALRRAAQRAHEAADAVRRSVAATDAAVAAQARQHARDVEHRIDQIHRVEHALSRLGGH